MYCYLHPTWTLLLHIGQYKWVWLDFIGGRGDSCWNNLPITVQYVQITCRHQRHFFELFSVSLNAIWWYAILGSSLAGHHCCLWRLPLCHEICSKNHCTLYLRGTRESFPGIREENTWCYPWKYNKTCTYHIQHNGYCKRAKHYHPSKI